MASRNFSRVQALNHEVKIIAGIISITAAGVPSVKEGIGFSVSTADQQSFEIKLEDKYVAVLSATATPKTGSVVVDDYDVESATFKFAAVVSAATELHFVLLLRNSTVK